jgi:hypothetical protein
MNAFTKSAYGVMLLGVVIFTYGGITYLRLRDVPGYLWIGLAFVLVGVAMWGYELYDRAKREPGWPHNKGLRPPGKGGV